MSYAELTCNVCSLPQLSTRCAKLEAPAHGSLACTGHSFLAPCSSNATAMNGTNSSANASCTVHAYATRCNVACEPGYFLRGPRSTSCQKQSTWSANVSQSVCYPTVALATDVHVRVGASTCGSSGTLVQSGRLMGTSPCSPEPPHQCKV